MKKLLYCFAFCMAVIFQITPTSKRIPGGPVQKGPTRSILLEVPTDPVRAADDGEDVDGDLFFDAAPTRQITPPVASPLKPVSRSRLPADAVVAHMIDMESLSLPPEDLTPVELPVAITEPVRAPTAKEHAAAFDQAVATRGEVVIPQFRKRSDSPASTESSASSVSIAREIPRDPEPKPRGLVNPKSSLFKTSAGKKAEQVPQKKTTPWERLKKAAAETERQQEEALQREEEWEEHKPELLKKIDRAVQKTKDFRDGDFAMGLIRLKQKIRTKLTGSPI